METRGLRVTGVRASQRAFNGLERIVGSQQRFMLVLTAHTGFRGLVFSPKHRIADHTVIDYSK
jgi:hypothetical protein